MKNLWKFAAALAAIAGSVVLIARYGDKFLARLQKLRDRCCHGGCSSGEKLAEAVEEAVEHVAEGAEEVLENVEQAAEEAVEAPQEAVTEEDFAD